MIFSIVIPTCNRNELLGKCLNQLHPSVQNFSADNYEVIVTDDSKTNAAKTFIENNYTWVNWVEGPKRGPAANRNNGAKIARGEWLIFLDDDCEPDEILLKEYKAQIETYATVNVFEGRIYCKEKNISPLFVSPVNENGGNLWSCNFCIKKSFFEVIGMFDELYKYPALEDSDLMFRILTTGTSEIIFCNKASVHHPKRKLASPKKLARYHESWFYFYQKNYSKKKLYQLLTVIFFNRLDLVRKNKLSYHSIIAIKNLFLELLFSIYYFYFNYETSR